MKAYNISGNGNKVNLGAAAVDADTDDATKNSADMVKQPMKKFRAGPICATIWANEGQGRDGNVVSYNTVSLERSYKNKNGDWQTTSSMRINDLPRASLVATKAYEYLVLNQAISDNEASS